MKMGLFDATMQQCGRFLNKMYIKELNSSKVLYWIKVMTEELNKNTKLTNTEGFVSATYVDLPSFGIKNMKKLSLSSCGLP
jgi:hypothetical protein